MTERKQNMLRKVRALLARADHPSTPEPEADTARRMADDLMLKYQIEEYELKQPEERRRIAVRRDIDLTWYYDHSIPYEVRSNLWSLFYEVAEHCRVVVSPKFVGSFANNDRKVICYGADADLDYMDMLFTSLWLQMSAKIKPKFDPNRSLGENVYMAKEAGMKYKDIAAWVGHPEWVVKDEYTGKVKSISKRLITAYKAHAKEHNLQTHQEVSLQSYIRDFSSGYVSAVAQKLLLMREGQGRNTGSMAIALRDMLDLAKESMYEDFPELRPHPDDCDCDKCHFCGRPDCQRPRCKNYRALKPRRGRGSFKETRVSWIGMAKGGQAGQEAKIVGRGGEGLRRQDELKK